MVTSTKTQIKITDTKHSMQGGSCWLTLKPGGMVEVTGTRHSRPWGSLFFLDVTCLWRLSLFKDQDHREIQAYLPVASWSKWKRGFLPVPPGKNPRKVLRLAQFGSYNPFSWTNGYGHQNGILWLVRVWVTCSSLWSGGEGALLDRQVTPIAISVSFQETEALSYLLQLRPSCGTDTNVILTCTWH